MTPATPITMKTLWKEFLPLSLSDVTLACSDPLMNTALAHLPGSHLYMASVGIAKSLVVCFESPIIMLLHASNALAEDMKARKALWRFMMLMCGIITLLLIVVSVPFVFTWIATKILHISDPMMHHVRLIILWVIFWPAVIGWRRYYQGLLIHGGYANAIGKAGVGRVIAVALILVWGFYNNLRGDTLAGITIIGGIVAESLLVTLAAYKKGVMGHCVDLIPKNQDQKYPHSMKEVFKFYWPLGNSRIVMWGGRAALVPILARSSDSIITLAAWPVAWSLVLTIANATRMVQQIIIRHRGQVSDQFLFSFALSVGCFFTMLLLIVVTTSFGRVMIQSFVGNDPSLLSHVRPVIFICSIVPLFLALQNAIQGFLISEGNTGSINTATWISTISLLILTLLGIHSGFSGTVAVSFAMLASLCIEMFWLMKGLVKNA